MRTLPVLLSAAVVLASAGCRPAPRPEAVGTPAAAVTSSAPWNMKDKITKTDAEWRQQLSAEQFRVLREHGTERAFSGAFARSHDPGTYHCAACGLDLFGADAKFESGTGWPSFWKPIAEGHVGSTEDRGFFMTRTEVRCARCDGHLGHVFDDGPAPTGKRFCINSASLTFEKPR